MRKLFYFLLLLPHVLLLGQKVEYVHMGKSYAVDGATNGEPFYLVGGREVPLPHGGEYHLVEDEEAFDPKRFYLPPFFSLQIKDVLPLSFEGPQAEELELSDRMFSPYRDPRILNMEGAWTVEELRGGALLVVWMHNGKVSYIGNQGWLDTGDRVDRLKFELSLPLELRDGYPVLAVVKNSRLLPVSKSDYLSDALKAAATGDVAELRSLDKRALRGEDAFESNALHKAAHYGQVAAVAYLIGEGFSPGDENEFGQTPLILAAMAGRKEIVSAMVAANEREISAEDNTGSNALHYAVLSGDATVVESLLQSKRGKGLIESLNDSGYTPLELAITDGSDEAYGTVKDLANGRELKTVLETSEGSLTTVSAMGAALIVQDLLGAGAAATDDALIAAITAGTEEVAELLIKHGANVNSASYGEHGLTPLMAAAHVGRADAAAFLLEHGAHIDAETKRGATALWLAVARNREDVVKILLSNGANTSIKELPPPLELALYTENQAIIKELVDAGAACNIDLGNVDSLLERALRNDVASVVSSALGVCIEPDYKIAGIYPLQWAALYYEATSVMDVLPPAPEVAGQIHFATPKQLDEQLQPITITNPFYPEELIKEYGDISAKVRIIISADGSVKFPKIVENPAPEMTQHIAEALSQWKFQPPLKDGEPTQVQCIVPVIVNAPAKDRAVWQLFDLDTLPQAIKQIPPQYPREARRQGRTGIVVVQFIVNEQGLVMDPMVVESQRFLGRAALDAVEQWRFQPGMKNGKPVKVVVRQPLVFELR